MAYYLAHYRLAKEACKRIEKLEGLNMIRLFGSVSRGEQKENSDIDLALILDDSMRAFPQDINLLPYGYEQRIDEMVEEISNPLKIEFHISMYYQSDYDKGISLDQGKKVLPDLLDEVGYTLYETDMP